METSTNSPIDTLNATQTLAWEIETVRLSGGTHMLITSRILPSDAHRAANGDTLETYHILRVSADNDDKGFSISTTAASIFDSAEYLKRYPVSAIIAVIRFKDVGLVTESEVDYIFKMDALKQRQRLDIHFHDTYIDAQSWSFPESLAINLYLSLSPKNDSMISMEFMVERGTQAWFKNIEEITVTVPVAPSCKYIDLKKKLDQLFIYFETVFKSESIKEVQIELDISTMADGVSPREDIHLNLALDCCKKLYRLFTEKEYGEHGTEVDIRMQYGTTSVGNLDTFQIMLLTDYLGEEPFSYSAQNRNNIVELWIGGSLGDCGHGERHGKVWAQVESGNSKISVIDHIHKGKRVHWVAREECTTGKRSLVYNLTECNCAHRE